MRLTHNQLVSYYVDVKGYSDDDLIGYSADELWDNLDNDSKKKAIAYYN